jgi:hypothetical protein
LHNIIRYSNGERLTFSVICFKLAQKLTVKLLS